MLCFSEEQESEHQLKIQLLSMLLITVLLVASSFHQDIPMALNRFQEKYIQNCHLHFSLKLKKSPCRSEPAQSGDVPSDVLPHT